MLDCLQGKVDVTLHVVGTTYKSCAMLGIACYNMSAVCALWRGMQIKNLQKKYVQITLQ